AVHPRAGHARFHAAPRELEVVHAPAARVRATARQAVRPAARDPLESFDPAPAPPRRSDLLDRDAVLGRRLPRRLPIAGGTPEGGRPAHRAPSAFAPARWPERPEPPERPVRPRPERARSPLGPPWFTGAA